MDWQTFTISILGSGTIAALVTAGMNHLTQIRAIKESGLYSKRVEILDEMMKRMERLNRISGELVSFFQYDNTDKAEDERRAATIKAFNYFFGFYKRNRHYLPKKLSDEISTLCNNYKKLYLDFTHEARVPGKMPDLDSWTTLVKQYDEELADQGEKIAEEFRKLIGVK